MPVKKFPMNSNSYFFQLLTASLAGYANAVKLTELNTLMQDDPELKYIMEVLLELWEQEPETDHVAMSAAWERLKEKI